VTVEPCSRPPGPPTPMVCSSRWPKTPARRLIASGSSKISHPCRISTLHVVTLVANDSRFDQPHTVRFTLSSEGQLFRLRLDAEDREKTRWARAMIGCTEHQGPDDLAAWLASGR